jgi:hypothetical protein
MPKSTFVEIPEEQQSQMLAALRRARYGYLLALHILLLCAAGRTPRAIADVLFCSRSSVTARCEPIARGPWAWSTTARGSSSPPYAPPC